jgi:hypothetical protein
MRSQNDMATPCLGQTKLTSWNRDRLHKQFITHLSSPYTLQTLIIWLRDFYCRYLRDQQDVTKAQAIDNLLHALVPNQTQFENDILGFLRSEPLGEMSHSIEYWLKFSRAGKPNQKTWGWVTLHTTFIVSDLTQTAKIRLDDHIVGLVLPTFQLPDNYNRFFHETSESLERSTILDDIIIRKFGFTHQFDASSSLDPQICKEDTLYCTRLFHDISPAKYRKAVYTSCDRNASPVTFNFPNDIQSQHLPSENENIDYDIRKVPSHAIVGMPNTWIPLTTITQSDHIAKASIVCDFPFDFGYSLTARQYYIKPLSNTETESRQYLVSYTLGIGANDEIYYKKERIFSEHQLYCFDLLNSFQFEPDKIATLKQAFATLTCEEKLVVLQHHFHYFEQKDLSIPHKTLTLAAMNLMLKEQKGVCGHNALLCREITEIFGMNANFVGNDLHAFCEVDGHTLDVGGGQSKVVEFDLSQAPIDSMAKLCGPRIKI